jgi:hypothetical protein
MNTRDARVALPSSLVASIAYMDDATLEVEFRRGTVYRYRNVPRAIFDGLIQADSAGQYFRRHIQNRFSSERLA